MSTLAWTRRSSALWSQLATSPATTTRLFSSARTTKAADTPVASTITPSSQLLPPRPLNLYVKSTRNNTIMSLVGAVKNGQQGTFFNVSGGTAGFKKVQRSGYEAGYQCAVRMFAKIQELAEAGPVAVTLLYNGFGQGREAATRALLSPDGELVRPHFVRVTDRTPIKIGGVRPKKKRTL